MSESTPLSSRDENWLDSSVRQQVIALRLKLGCSRCGKPWSVDDIQRELHVIGISCSRCWDGDDLLDRDGAVLWNSRYGWVGMMNFDPYSREFMALYARQRGKYRLWGLPCPQ